MALRLGELSAVISVDQSPFDRGLDAGERRFSRFGRHVESVATSTEAATKDHGRKTGKGFADEFESGIGGITGMFGVFGKFGEAIGSVAESATKGSAQVFGLGSSVAQAAGPIGAVVALLVALAAAASAFGAAASIGAAGATVLGAAIGAIPAVSVGAIAGIGALVVGFMGIADQFKKTKSGGGGAVGAIGQVERAERGLARAQRDVLKAQEDLNRARAEAAEDVEDLDRSLRRAQLGEKQAARALADARKAITDARASGDIDELRKAQLAYEDAAMSVEEARDRTEDLAAEQQHAAKVGVEGSDKVQSALERQQSAIDALADAQQSLNQARQGAGGGGAADELMRIAPAAAAAVAAIKALKPAWEDLRLSVQERLFSGLDVEIRDLAGVWLPKLKAELGAFADTFNGTFKTLSTTLQDSEVADGFMVGMEAVRGILDKVGEVAAGPLVKALSQLSEASKPFLDAIGDRLAAGLLAFSTWIDKLDKAGKLDAFFESATGFFNDVIAMGKDVGVILGTIVSIMFGENKDLQKDSPWEALKSALHDIAAWFQDDKNREKLAQYINMMMRLGSIVIDVISWFVRFGLATQMVIQTALDGIGSAWNTIQSWGGSLLGWLNGIRSSIGGILSGMWDGLWQGFRSTINMVIGAWNRLSFGVPQMSIFGQSIGGGRLDTPDIPYLATGGTATADGMAWVAERGPELIQMPRGARVTPLTGPNAPGGDPAMLAGLVAQAVRQATAHLTSGDVVVQVGSDPIARLAKKAVLGDPTAVALANRNGSRRLGYVG